jgi:N5-(cytidine 5'-diphosphoramidyl)-L-glutamine hydrolase
LKIGITPSVKETYKKQYEFSIDVKLISFLRYCFPRSKIFVITEISSDISNMDLIIISGGNDLHTIKKSKSNLFRNKIDKKILKISIKKNITVIGFCYGAQLISHFFDNKIIKKKNHVRKINKIFSKNNSYINKNLIKIKCFHNYSIKTCKNFEEIAFCADGSVEFYKVKENMIFGIMWHPERNLNLKKINKSILKKICS